MGKVRILEVHGSVEWEVGEFKYTLNAVRVGQ